MNRKQKLKPGLKMLIQLKQRQRKPKKLEKP